jgi:hypothetical protein
MDSHSKVVNASKSVHSIHTAKSLELELNAVLATTDTMLDPMEFVLD